MRGRLLYWPAVARLFGYIAIAVAMVAAVVHVSRQAEPTPAAARTMSGNALQRELIHCQSIGKAAREDDACIAAWAENRRRFFGSGAPDKPNGVTTKPNATAQP